MSGDLISRKQLIYLFENQKEKSEKLHELIFFDMVLAIIEAAPPAYDMDKVMEEIREYADKTAEFGGVFLPKAVIEIVKGGGLNE